VNADLDLIGSVNEFDVPRRDQQLFLSKAAALPESFILLLGSRAEHLFSFATNPAGARSVPFTAAGMPLWPRDEVSKDELIALPACPAHVLPLHDVDAPTLDHVE
jgi:hypothetical protein